MQRGSCRPISLRRRRTWPFSQRGPLWRGALQKNNVRLKRHFSLADSKGKDPLNAKALASGKHKTDAENYRGLGYRTDPKERGRFVELFLLQAESESGITTNSVDAAIKKYHAKLAHLDYLKAKNKGS